MTRENAQLLAKEIVSKLEGLTVDEADTPMTNGSRRSQASLARSVTCISKRAAARFGFEELDLSHFPDRHLTMVHYLLHASLDSAYDGLVQLHKGLNREWFSKLVDLILTIWVGPEASPNLHAIVTRSRERRVLAINARYQDTAEDYIMRALGCSIPKAHIIVATDVSGTGLAAELLPRYIRALQRKLNLGQRSAELAVREYLDRGADDLFILLGDGATGLI